MLEETKDDWGGGLSFELTRFIACRADEKRTAAGPSKRWDWGEWYFHLQDPDGHELSFAQLLS